MDKAAVPVSQWGQKRQLHRLPGTWERYPDAVEVVAEGAADGIGFALLGSNIGAVDLDHCRDADSGGIPPWADDIRAKANGSYCEVTVSGSGLRIIGQVANETECHRKFTIDRATDGGIEIYPELRALYHSEWVGDRALH